MRPNRQLRLGFCLAAALATTSAQAQSPIVEPLTIQVDEIERFDRGSPDNRYGALTFLGGLRLNSSHRRFEGLSGLEMIGDRLLMVTDNGDWLSAELTSAEDGSPLALSDAVIGPLLDIEGTPMRTKRLADAEAITVVGEEVWVTSERNRPIRAYSIDDHQLVGAASLPFGPEAPLRERWNLGLEALVHVTEGPLAGETLAFLEEPPRSASAPTAARLTAEGDIIAFAVQRRDRFAITGAAMIPGGDILLVERRFSWDDGIFMRITLLPAEEILEGAVQSRHLLQADGATVIDNMEGIAVSDHPNGPIITLISDDNGNFFQQTILLRFQITGSLEDLPVLTPPAPVARPNL